MPSIDIHSHNEQISNGKFVHWGEISAVSKIIPPNPSRFFKIHGRYIGDDVSYLIYILNINPLSDLGNRKNYFEYANFFLRNHCPFSKFIGSKVRGDCCYRLYQTSIKITNTADRILCTRENFKFCRKIFCKFGLTSPIFSVYK